MKRSKGTEIVLLLASAVTLAACGDEVTSVRLQIVTAPGLAPDGLAVSIDDSRHEEPMTDSLQLLVPDDWAGRAKRIEVEGTSIGATVAVGLVVVTPIAGQQVTATVTLVDASCARLCGIGEIRCEGDGVVACELGADGCPQWSGATACPVAAPFCSNGTCSDTCADECTTNATVCEINGSVRTCGQTDSDSCLDWSSPVSCPGSEVCAGGACTAAFELTVIKTGNGFGTVTSMPSGIVCGATCTASYAAGTQVTLTATPVVGTTFTGWSGGSCSGIEPCVVMVNAATHVTATFFAPFVGQVDAGLVATGWVKADRTVVSWGITNSPPAGSFASVAAGWYHMCGVKTDGTIVCWGDNGAGQANAPAVRFASVSASRYHSCGIKTDGTVACWGDNNAGQASPPAGSFVDVSAGGRYTCGVKTSGAVACWGSNDSGEGLPPAGNFASVSAGDVHACGVKTSGTVACWGSNDGGKSTPPAGFFASVSAGGNHTCGVKTDGTLACWGYNYYGQAIPPGGTFANVSAGYDHSCGVKTDGTVACWGDNADGQATPP